MLGPQRGIQVFAGRVATQQTAAPLGEQKLGQRRNCQSGAGADTNCLTTADHMARECGMVLSSLRVSNCASMCCLERVSGRMLTSVKTLPLTLSLVACSIGCASSPAPVEVSFTSGQAILAGTLYLPANAGPHPAVILVHGSGPQTRDSYVPFAKVFARHGVATLIYDKRGTGASTGDWQRAPFAALADDAAAGVEYLRRRVEIDSLRVGIWGGSEGGWIAPWVASINSNVAFVVVQSAPVVSAATQHLYQVDRIMTAGGVPPAIRDSARKYVLLQHRYSVSGEGWAEYAATREANRASPPLAMLGGPPTPDDWWWAWWRTKMAFEPVSAWERVSVPVLALWGERDENVPVEESRAALDDALRRADNRDATLRVIGGADHDLVPQGFRRVFMIAERLTVRPYGYTPAMTTMAIWMSSRFVTAHKP